MHSTASQNVEELIRLVSSHLFSPEFEDRYPDYPKFTRLSQPVTETARANSAMEAIRRLCGRTSNLGSVSWKDWGSWMNKATSAL
jgi:hypothetical protein